MVETQIVRLVIRIFPVVHKRYKGVGRVISLIGLPGVNVAKCLQRVCDPRYYDGKHGDLGRSREALWRELVHSELGVMEGEICHADMEGRLCDFENYKDIDYHVFHLCSETMITKKLLTHVSDRLTSMGLHAATEMRSVQIPGIANPHDRRCGTHTEFYNCNMLSRALSLEGGSIMAWVKAFELCRAHHCMSLSPNGGAKRKGGATDPGEDMEDTLDNAILANRAATANTFDPTRPTYQLPTVLRPVYVTEPLPDYDEVAVSNGTAPTSLPSIAHDDAWCGFLEGAVTLVARPIVSEDFFMDFSKGFEIGEQPPLVRIVLLDFVIGCSDKNVAECVLSDADLEPLTTLGRQQRFHSTQANCMDTYVRQDVFGAWKAGFDKHQRTMADNYQNTMPSWAVIRLLMEKADFYAKQAIQFHCSNIMDGVYRSEILTHVSDMYKQLKSVLHDRVKANLKDWGRSHRPHEWNEVDSITQMRLLFYRALQEFNKAAKMSYTNLAIVLELFTTMMQWFIHPGNSTWSNWLIPIQVVPQKAQLYRQFHPNGSKGIVVEKPNSSGIDEIACRGFDGMMKLCNEEVTRGDGRALDLGMCKAGRETPVARERRNKVMICRNMVIAEPDPSLVNRMQSSTEERNLGDADLDAKIRVTPRNRTTIRDGTVYTTDTTEKGNRESQRWEPVGGYHIAVQATNCRITSMKNQEQWETNLVATKCMSTGRETEKTRKRNHRGDYTVNHASGSSQAVRDTNKQKQLSTLLCVLPHIAGSFIGFMNKLGFTNMEISPVTRMYMDWMYWRFDSLFSKFVGVRLSKSFQRTTQGHYGRHIADYAMARLTLEVSKHEDFDTALVRTINALSYNCLPLGGVPVWMDDSIREGMDGQLLVLHSVISSMLHVPNLNLAWLTKALQPYGNLSDQERLFVDNHADAMKLALWVKSLVDNDQFIYEQDITVHGGGVGGGDTGDGGGFRVERGSKRTYPYITTPANASDEQAFLRTRTKNKGHASDEIAAKLVQHPDMVLYSKHTGFTVDEQVGKCMIDRCSHLTLGLEDAFGTQDLCNPETLFALVRRKLGDYAVISPISETGTFRTNANIDPSYGMMQTVTVFDTHELMFGVNMTLSLLLTSMVDGTNGASSQVDERLTRSLMWLMMRDVPTQFIGQSGSKYLRKNFRGMCPGCDLHVLGGYTEPRPAYIVRPVHDHEKASNRMTQFPCDVYRTYAPEDCAHMGELAALAQNYNAVTVLDICLTYATPRYMFMYDMVYPVTFTEEGTENERRRLGYDFPDRVRGYVTITTKDPSGHPSWKIRYFDPHGPYYNTEGPDVSDIDEALSSRRTVVLPLISRHNAVIYSEQLKTFGVIQPQDLDVHMEFRPDLLTYFNSMPSVWGYSVLMEGYRSANCSHIDALTLEHNIVALASDIWIRLDVYISCKGPGGSHADASYSSTNPNQKDIYLMYIRGTVAYPTAYPKNLAQFSSIFVEIQYAGNGDTLSDRWDPLEINLDMLTAAGVYHPPRSTPPLCREDPRKLKKPCISRTGHVTLSTQGDKSG